MVTRIYVFNTGNSERFYPGSGVTLSHLAIRDYKEERGIVESDEGPKDVKGSSPCDLWPSTVDVKNADLVSTRDEGNRRGHQGSDDGNITKA